MKLNHAKRKREITARLFLLAEKRMNKEKVKNGDYCLASIDAVILEDTLLEARKAIAEGYSYSKTMYVFFEERSTADIFMAAVEKMWIEKYWRKRLRDEKGNNYVY